MLNKVILIGRLTSDPQLKWTANGTAVTSFSLAVDRPMSSEARQAGQEKQTDFIDITAWRQLAEFASNYLSKGRLVAVDGRLQIRQYVAQDGTPRRAAEVVADQLRFLDKPRDTAHPEAEGAPYASSGGGSVPPPRQSGARAAAGASAVADAPSEPAGGDPEVDDPFAEE